MNVTASQFKGILWKNFLISYRTKQFLREIISVIILGTFIVIVQNTQTNNFITPFYLSLALIGYSRSVGFTWVLEKEMYQKQLQNIMGISFFGYSIAWLSFFLLNSVYVCGIMLLILKFGVIMPNDSTFIFADGYGFGHVVILYILYAISIIGFVLTLSAFFNKAKVAAQAMVFAQLILNFFYFLRFSEDFRTNRALILLASIFPQVSFNFGICSIAFIDKSFPTLQFTYADSVVSLSIASIFYLALSFYLEQVLPNSQGTNKHPLFFLRKIMKKNKNREGQNELLLTMSEQNEPDYSQDRHGEEEEPMIKLRQLSKKFGQKVAVDKVSMKFYSNQIFCLLGHNGAGKSTTINLLTGLQKPTSGNIQLMGLDYQHDLDEIRKNVGLCLQFNVLYDDLTIEEHLKFYALLKRLDSNSIQQNIEQIINECALVNEKGKFVKNLSGGNKRKLSLANALIGKSKVIFLDQPSSGLDPNSRQGIWNIIKSLRTPQRSLILTTHHLEEAEELSQVIGIMSQGKMVIIGDSSYIKQKFNVGLHVVLSFNEQNKNFINDCRKAVLQSIVGSKQDEQTALNTLKFLLPPSQIKSFWKLFQTLQSKCSLSVKMSDLEDAFIKLGEQIHGQQANVINDPDIALPDAYCSFSYKRQFKAVFYRKITTTFRSFSAVVSIALPTIFILLGVLMSCVAISGNTPVEQFVKRYLMSFFMVWAFIFNTSTFCGDLVLQRQKRFKYLSHVLGLRKLPYWTANYTFDLMIFTIPLSIFFIVIFSMGEDSRFLTDVAGYLVILFILFAFSFIGYSYLFSFMFQKSSTAFRLFPFFNLIFFFVIPSIPMNMKNSDTNILAQYVCPMISPFIAFFNSFFTKEIMGEQAQAPFKSKSLYFDYGCLIGQALLFPILTIFIQNLRFKLKDRQVVFNQQEQQEQQHGQFYDAQHINEGDEIYIKNLYKKYSNGYMAIRDNSFSVKKGEIFGLLGPNGAGKSTTFNIVTAALSKTAGEVKILNQQINNGIMDIFSQFGVCPQYDSIYENVTTEEHMYYIARVKGIKEEDIPNLIKYYYDLLSLTPYVKVQAGNLSGGNKRKLAVSMAMLANPQIMFFDEPSSGVDPISRRFLWKSLYLSSRTKDAAMVLTTHTMSEAQSLCSRIGILIKGKFITVASPSQLKKKYGKGFRIEIKYETANENEIIGKLKGQFGQNVVIDKLPEQSRIVFTVENSKFSYSKAYRLLQNTLLQKNIILKYEIKQSTLEEVFLFLSQLQPPVQTVEYHQPWQFCCWECGQDGCAWI